MSLAESVTVRPHQPMYVGLICSIFLSGEISRQQNAIQEIIGGVEARTGYHEWSKCDYDEPARGDFTDLSSRVSGSASRLASVTRKMKSLQELNVLILANTGCGVSSHLASCTKNADIKGESRSPFRDTVLLIERRIRMQRIDSEMIQRRIEVQLSTVRCPFMPSTSAKADLFSSSI